MQIMRKLARRFRQPTQFATIRIEGASETGGGGEGRPLPVVSAMDIAAERAILDAARDPETGNLRWPDDPQEEPDWFRVVEARARRYGLPLPLYRTRAECEAQEDLCELTAVPEPYAITVEPEPGDMEPDDAGPPLPELPAGEAARLFLADLRWEMDDTGTDCQRFSSREIWSRYMEYCEAENRTPSSQNFLLGEFVKLPGVSKKKEDVPRAQRGHKRERPVVYTILRVAPSARVVDLRMAA